ncbi:MAG: thermosome subunit alpha [Thaumarchaeota archaeon]|nr:thermosome subunit alpha [Nitrososphaerota archaeon]
MSAQPVQALGPSGQVRPLLEGRTQMRGQGAMENNVAAARLICSIVRTSLGPHGMDKMLVSDQDVATITNDGATMLKDMAIQHPAGRILVEVSKATDTGVGDGTTSVVVLAGALLEGAEELLVRGVHPIVVVSGYRAAAAKALEILDSLGERVEPRDRDALVKVATTSMQSKIIAANAAKVASIVVDAALGVAIKQDDGTYRVDQKTIKVEKKEGGSMADTELIRGIILDQKVAGPAMPRRVEKARIALLNLPFEVNQEARNVMMTISKASELQDFLGEEVEMYRRMVDKVVAAGANVVICQKKIDEMGQHFLAQAGILAVEKSYEYEAPNIARATGARMVPHLNDLTEQDLGYADIVEERKVGPDKMLFVIGAKNPRSITILTRGANKKVAEEAERSIHDAVMVVKDMIHEPTLVVGGGATEAEVAVQLARWATGVEGREQLAAEKFAQAMEEVPRTLAENAGLDPINLMAELRARHLAGGEGKWYGIPATGKTIKNLRSESVLEPLAVKRQVIVSATEAVCMLLRIDNVIAIPPARKPHAYEKEIADAKAQGHKPFLSPSRLASQV